MPEIGEETGGLQFRPTNHAARGPRFLQRGVATTGTEAFRGKTRGTNQGLYSNTLPHQIFEHDSLVDQAWSFDTYRGAYHSRSPENVSLVTLCVAWIGTGSSQQLGFPVPTEMRLLNCESSKFSGGGEKFKIMPNAGSLISPPTACTEATMCVKEILTGRRGAHVRF